MACLSLNTEVPPLKCLLYGWVFWIWLCPKRRLRLQLRLDLACLPILHHWKQVDLDRRGVYGEVKLKYINHIAIHMWKQVDRAVAVAKVAVGHDLSFFISSQYRCMQCIVTCNSVVSHKPWHHHF